MTAPNPSLTLTGIPVLTHAHPAADHDADELPHVTEHAKRCLLRLALCAALATLVLALACRLGG
jgi:hypothetical protein